MKNIKKIEKLAKEVGVQGYAFMNDRAFCNCHKEAYNTDPEEFLSKYVPLGEIKKVKTSQSIKDLVKENFIKDVEELRAESKYVGASVRNVLRSYAVAELKDKIEKTTK
jgi:hypothetical protein